MKAFRSPSFSGSYSYKDLISYRRKLYLLVIIFGVLLIFSTHITAHADLFGFEIQDVYANITENVQETNDILDKAFQFSQTSPYDVVNGLTGSPRYTTISVVSMSKSMALVVATLLLMVEFFRKSINFEWSSKWENILLFLIKIIVIKQLIQNADVMVSYIYSFFQNLNKSATISSEYLPCGTVTRYYCQVPQSIAAQLKKGWWDFWYDIGAGETYNEFYYDISPDAVKMFYPNATFPASTNLTDNPLANPTEKLNYMPTLEMILLQPYFLVMKAIAYIIFVIAIGRVFELAVYTIFAPLPLSTFASDTTHDVAKTFIKNYIATVIQIAVIVIMFLVFVAVNKYVVELFPSTKLLQFVILISLALSVVKSGSWARKLCGLG